MRAKSFVLYSQVVAGLKRRVSHDRDLNDLGSLTNKSLPASVGSEKWFRLSNRWQLRTTKGNPDDERKRG